MRKPRNAVNMSNLPFPFSGFGREDEDSQEDCKTGQPEYANSNDEACDSPIMGFETNGNKA